MLQLLTLGGLLAVHVRLRPCGEFLVCGGSVLHLFQPEALGEEFVKVDLGLLREGVAIFAVEGGEFVGDLFFRLESGGELAFVFLFPLRIGLEKVFEFIPKRCHKRLSFPVRGGGGSGERSHLLFQKPHAVGQILHERNDLIQIHSHLRAIISSVTTGCDTAHTADCERSSSPIFLPLLPTNTVCGASDPARA